MSSILKIVIAASVANFKLLIFDILGSRTPADRLFLTFPFRRSNPECFSSFFFSSSEFYAALWKTLNLAIRSVASFAALIASVLGTTSSASENSAIANYSLVPSFLAKSSRNIDKATSTAPPPATILFDSRTLLTTQRASWMLLSISSIKKSLAPLIIIVYALVYFIPLKNIYSQSPTLSSYTLSHYPRFDASYTSSPS